MRHLVDPRIEALFAFIKNPKCELNFSNLYELTVAVLLSAQTTDKKVNAVTSVLFKKYPNWASLRESKTEDLALILKPLGLSLRKSKLLKALALKLLDYQDKLPKEKEELLSLPGIGEKTCAVILTEGFSVPAIAVDTHVKRVSNRLGLSAHKDPTKIMKDLEKLVPEKFYHRLHLTLVHFGRYFCLASKPKCDICILKKECSYYQNLDLNHKDKK